MARSARRMLLGLPANAPVIEALVFPAPTNPNFNFNTQLTLAAAFTVTEAGSFLGITLLNPQTDSAAGPIAVGGNSTAGTLIQQQAFVPLSGLTQDVDFAAPIPVVPGQVYFAGVWGTRAAITTTAFPLASLSGRIQSANGLFDTGGTPVVPTSVFTTFYQISPRVEFP